MPERTETSDTKRLEFLQADLAAMKQEIASRSGMQERATALYLASLAILVGSMSDLDPTIVVAAAWVVSWLALNFWTREALEIQRLGGLIRDRVLAPAATLLGCTSSDLCPSEADAASPVLDPRTNRLQARFKWAAFFWIPAAISLAELWANARHIDDFLSLRRPGLLLFIAAFVAAWSTFALLRDKEQRSAKPTRPSRANA